MNQTHAPRDQQTVDEASAESFPASDAPSWTPTHAGTPAASRTDTPRELRAKLRGDVATLRAGSRAGSVDAAERVAATMLLAGRSVTRIPVAKGAAAECVEAVIRGASSGPETILGARYLGPDGALADASGAAVLLGLARVLEGRRFARTVRLVAFADDARTTGARAYAKRLQAQRASVGGLLVLGRVSASRGAPLGMVADRGARHLLAAAREVWGGATPLALRTMTLPRTLGFLFSDRRPFAREGWPTATLTSLWPALGAGAPPDELGYEAMCDVVFGLAAVVARLAGSA